MLRTFLPTNVILINLGRFYKVQSGRQRIRDPLHNLVEFENTPFDRMLWKVLQTRPFQRLRRIKQLGFSELTYPGATHTRFAHSVGVFHTARQLLEVVKRNLGSQGFEDIKAQTALAAALLHDLGHGPFSHAFEAVGKRRNWKIQRHEKISDILIRNGEVKDELDAFHGHFGDNVADLIKSERPKTLYGAIVSSQFDADRLDYMRRDRLMTGSHHGSVDLDWLLSNLETAKIPYGEDEEQVGEVETFVLGPKATYAAESYILSLFQLYPTVYMHKATRGAEKVFVEILDRLFVKVQEGAPMRVTGLPQSHPLVKFANSPENIDCFLALDDSVVWGALSMMASAADPLIREFSMRLRDRKLFKCFEIQTKADSMETLSEALKTTVDEWNRKHRSSLVLIDYGTREPYKNIQGPNGGLSRIMIKTSAGKPVDVASVSDVVRALDTFRFLRLYAAQEDEKGTKFVKDILLKVNKQ